MTVKDHGWDFLSEREAAFTKTAMDALRALDWAKPLIAAIEESGGLTKATMALLFELRFAYALHQVGVVPAYEVAGEGESTIDFGFAANDRDWRVELFRLEETAAVKAATKVEIDGDGVEWTERILSSDAADEKQTPEGETLKVIQRICQKCERDGRPHKFPAPGGGGVNVLLVDFRAHHGGGGDKIDRAHVAFGSGAVRGPFKEFWKGEPILGAFHEGNTMKGARELRERVHLLGFVTEKKFEDGAFGASIAFVANPHLFADLAEVRALFEIWPLKGSTLMNGGDG